LEKPFKHIAISCLLILYMIGINGCQNTDKKEKIVGKAQKEVRDLKEILQSNKLIVLAENSANSYFIYKGQKMGMEYEILSRFAKDIGVKLEIILIDDLDDIAEQLDNNIADIVACNYTITKDRREKVAFSTPFLQAPQVLVQRKPEDWRERKKTDWEKEMIQSSHDLSRKTVHVWQNSSFYKRLVNIQDELGDTIILKNLDGNITPEKAIEMVDKGFIDYTVVDENVAMINQEFHPNLDFGLELSIPQNIAFAMSKNTPLLRKRLDDWLMDFFKTPTYSFIKHKYLNTSRYAGRSKSEFSSISGKRISVYDQIIKEKAKKYGWDWRLIASLMFQESKFQVDAESFGGAYGLMQFIPEVGPSYGVYPDSPPAVQIDGGIRKLAEDYRFWKDIPDSIQRIKFTLASYNAGAGHILDGQRLAEKYGKDPLVWDNNVEVYIKLLFNAEYYRDEVVRHGYMRGNITYFYVREIISRYKNYKTAFPE